MNLDFNFNVDEEKTLLNLDLCNLTYFQTEKNQNKTKN